LKTVEFKFVLNDKEWVTSDEYWTIIDETGNKNNYIEFDDSGKIIKGSKIDAINGGKTEAGKTEMGKTIIPESGLAMGAPTPAGEVAAESNLDTTVMPSQEGVQTTLGEPGAFVPENPQDIAAFKEVRNVDAKELNAQIKKEEAEQAAAANDVSESKDVKTTVMPSQEGVQTTLGEPGAVVPENPQDIAAFKEVRNVDAKELNAQIKKEEAEQAAAANDVSESKDVKTTVMPSQEGVQTTLGEPGAVVPENPQDIAAFKEVRNVDAKELNAQIKEEEAAKAATVSADAEPAKPKYVKKVKKLVPKAEAEAKESTAAATSKPAPGSSTTSGSTAAKKEKKGIFSRIKKALQ
jgi:ribosomal protein L29